MQLAKKLGLSLGVVVVFIVYSMQQRNDTGGPVIAPPTPSTVPASSNAPGQQDNQPAASSSPAPTSTSAYKDGSYTGDAADAFYGFVQVEAIIKNGAISDVVFVQYPNDRRNSVEINDQAMPYLKQEAIQAQSSQVNIVTGATDTSQAFIQSLASALAKAKS
jgi:uncharacterized protein with FMN-binding domain